MSLRNFIQSSRRTGKTKRLIEKAKEAAEQGRAVYILTATLEHAQQIQTTNEALRPRCQKTRMAAGYAHTVPIKGLH